MLRHVCWSLVAALLVAAPVWAAEPAAKEKATDADLVQQLDAEDFADRQAASNQLEARGKEAIPALVEAAKGDSAEASTRSLDILRKHFAGSDSELKAAAKTALEKLAAGEGPVARRAGEVLAPKPMAPAAVQPPRIAPGIRLAPGGVRIAVAARAVGGKRMTFKEVDGVKEIEVVEGDRTIRIKEDPAGIKMEVTEKKDGKEESKKYEAKNAEDLKEKHPEAHKLYEENSKQHAGIRIEGLRIAPGFAPAPAIRRLDPPAIIREPKELTDRLEKAQQQLDEALEKLKSAAEDADDAADIRAAIEAIEASRKGLDEVRAKFPDR